MNRDSIVLPKMIAGVILILFSGLLMAQEESQGTSPAAYIKPDIDLSRYTKLMLTPLNASDIKVLKPAWEKDNTDLWTLELSNRRKIQGLYKKTMSEELETNGGYTLVRHSGPDVLRVEMEILNMTPYAKPGTPSKNGRYIIQTLNAGDLVFSAEFRDSQTRELLVLVEGDRNIGDTYQEFSQEALEKNLETLFTQWGVKIRERLDKANKK